MKEKWKNLSKRDQLSLVILVFLLVFAGLYFGITGAKETLEVLEEENSVLVQQQDLVNGLLRVIPKMEEDYDENREFLKKNYATIHQLNDSPIAFEEMFLEWLNGHQVKIDSFSVTEPALIPLKVDVAEEELDPYQQSVATLNGEEVETGQDENEGAPIGEQNSEEEVVYNALKQTYTYELTITEAVYQYLLDNLNNLSDYYYLESSTFTYDAEKPKWGVATLAIDVYLYDRPDEFKKADNLTYFEFNVSRPNLKPQNSGSENETPNSGNSSNETSNEKPTNNPNNMGKGQLTPEEESPLNDKSKFGIINAKGEYIYGRKSK